MSRAAGPRRWPDLMIGALVLLLLGGFGTMLLRPQSTAPVSATTDREPDSASPGIPGAPGTTGDVNSPVTAETTAITPTTPAQDTQAAPIASTPSGAAPEPTESSTATPGTDATDTATPDTEATPVIAAAPIGTPDPTLTGQTPGTPTDAAAATTESADSTATTDAPASSPTARAGGAVPTSEQRTPLRSDYRITLGTFSSVEAAQKAAQGVSNLGYTVSPIDLGSVPADLAEVQALAAR